MGKITISMYVMSSSSSSKTVAGQEICFTSFNCKGLNNPLKRSKVLHHIHQLGAHIMYLQETHLKNVDHVKLRKSWTGHIYHSSFDSKSRGVAILIHKSIPFVHLQTISDMHGSYVIVTGTIFNIPIAMVNVYGPNYDDEEFFKQLFSRLPDMSSYHLIMGGDFNCWLDPQLDRSSNKAVALSRSARLVNSFMTEFAVSDPLRFLNPHLKAYSFFLSGSPHLYTN